MHSNGGFIIGAGSSFSVPKTSQMNTLTIDSYSRAPRISAITTINTLIFAGFLSFLKFLILCVLRYRRLSEIGATIVKGVVVNVISFFRWATAKDFLVHPQCTAGPSSLRIIIAILFSKYKPIPLRKPLKVSGINDGIFTLRQRNQSVGLVERLDNLVSFHAVFHGSSLKGLLKFSRIITPLFASLILLSLLMAAPPSCDMVLWQHVYKPSRLTVHKACASATGTFVDATAGKRKDGVRHEADGDCHGWLKLDPGQEQFLNAGNANNEDGNLVFEIVCMFRVRQADAVQACKNYRNQIELPPIGSHVRVTGSWVMDDNHAHWNEIHPVSSIEVLGALPDGVNGAK